MQRGTIAAATAATNTRADEGRAHHGTTAVMRPGFKPSFSMRRYSAWRDSPSSRAACATTPCARASACSTVARSSVGSSAAGVALDGQIQRGRSDSRLLSTSRQARRMTFCSSRTFPGQG